MENIKSLIAQVNEVLLKGEPGNVSLDEHTNYTGYKPQAIVDAMNEVFEIGTWGFEELSSDIEPTEKSGLAVTKVKVWLKNVDFQPTGWGQNRVTRGDIGDARKGAQTDAIKKALSYFSVGNRAYHGLLVASPKGNNQQRATNQPTNGNTNRATNPVSTPTKPSTTTKTEPAAENKKLNEIPTVSQLKKDIAELQPKMKGNVMIWPDILAYVFKKSIDEGLLSLDGLVRAGDQLLPEHCEKIAAFVASLKAARAKQEAA